MAEPDWFDFKTHPLARYQANEFQALSGGEYLANGRLELKGVTHPVPVKFTWQVLDGKVALNGQASIPRLDFGIGEGDWATDEIIGLLVDVDFKLALSPCAAP
jgi:polyisoprenoid-binding protein YceI